MSDDEDRHYPVYILVLKGATGEQIARHTLLAERLMSEEQANARWNSTPYITVECPDLEAMHWIIGEAVIRNDWVVASGEPEDEPQGVVAIIGPTSLAGPILLAAAGEGPPDAPSEAP